MLGRLSCEAISKDAKAQTGHSVRHTVWMSCVESKRRADECEVEFFLFHFRFTTAEVVPFRVFRRAIVT